MAGGKVYEITGGDRKDFLQGLVTNDLGPLKDGAVYAALLTPQGKYLADFFLIERGEAILLDIAPALAEAALRRLAMYRLRADVVLAESPLRVFRSLDPLPGGLPDPRHPALGYRTYAAEGSEPEVDWDAIRVAQCIPESGIELVPEQSYILESGFERLGGVDFRKGCYVGQEVTARMKHKTELRKGLVTVEVQGRAPIGSAILAGERQVGTLYTQSGGRGIAHLRFDMATGPLRAAEARLTWAGAG
jgi:folate-binding protein YgfZ